MSNKIVQLENEAGDNIYPLAGGALTGSISKTMLEEGVFEGPELSEPSTVAYVATDNIQDGAVTSDKIDWTTMNPPYITLVSPSDGYGVFYKKIGNTVYVNVRFNGASYTDGSVIGTLPNGYRPPLEVWESNAFVGGGGAIQISSNGNVAARTSSGSTMAYIRAFLVFTI